MDDYYFDNWGEIKIEKNLRNWSDFEPWQFWETQFEWIDCGDEYHEQDIIAFRDDVVINHRDGSRTFKDGVRFNICRVANIKDAKAYLEVIHSEGEEAYSPNDHIYRSIKWLSRYGVQRWPREHSPTDNVTPEQKEKGMALKEEREKKASMFSTGSGGSYSRAFNKAKTNKQPRQSSFHKTSNKNKSRPLKP